MINLNSTHARKNLAGGYEKVPLTIFKRLEDKCSPSIEKGGVKLDSWHCDRT